MRNYDHMAGVQDVISLYYTLRDTVSLERIGMMYLSLNPDALLGVQDEEEDGIVLLVDETGEIIAGTAGTEVPSELLRELSLRTEEASGSFLFGRGADAAFAVYTDSAVSGWRLVEYIPYQSLIGESQHFMMLLTHVLIAAFAAIILLTVYGTRKSLAPLRRLRDSMLAVQEGNYDITVEVETQDEIGELAHTYNLMLARIKQLIAEIYSSEKQKREIELQVLQTQVNPHFLYNTLNSIYWMAVMHGLDSISNMVEALVGILRHSLQDFQQLTTLRQEIEVLRQYLFIQNVRFNNGISLEIEVADELLSARIPRLLLQPLAENAVLHGIRPRGGKGRIESAEEGRLIIEITDDGAGFPVPVPEFVSCDALKGTLPPSDKSFSIGLKNTHERLLLRFGTEYGLYVRSDASAGTTVRLVLPLMTGEEKGEGEA